MSGNLPDGHNGGGCFRMQVCKGTKTEGNMKSLRTVSTQQQKCVYDTGRT